MGKNLRSSSEQNECRSIKGKQDNVRKKTCLSSQASREIPFRKVIYMIDIKICVDDASMYVYEI